MKTSLPPSTHARQAQAVFKELKKSYPNAQCALHYRNSFELLCAVVLSAQTTDVAVNRITSALFAAYPTAETLAKADPQHVQTLIATIGMYRQKAKHLLGLATKLVEHHHGQVPNQLDDLIQLPGVGRKTANVVLGVAFGKVEGIAVDTHVQRLSQRLGWTQKTNPRQIEQDLCQIFPKKQWICVNHVLVLHGREICFARKPACHQCPIQTKCPNAFRAESAGRKSNRAL
ncbi:endonuclease III [Pajaroellobacter abortibovis]|uniref:Endonuclease III n=1 Tax=Pajaroellobacter abortibovis TaxID=1882918 RepID=A0A1L6MX38_9BACT|nr:endonuclease III [Pajaroellobacter abortibovis]APR99977.1 endonuclease III [Pajaroellobacter abortibovis]